MRRSGLSVALAAWTSCLAFGTVPGYRVVLPDLALAKNEEFVEELHLFVACGHIDSVASIPMDWSIEVVRMTAGAEELRATAGHGASRLDSLGRFNGGVRVVPIETDCFDVTAKVLTSGGRSREIQLNRKQLKLLP